MFDKHNGFRGRRHGVSQGSSVLVRSCCCLLQPAPGRWRDTMLWLCLGSLPSQSWPGSHLALTGSSPLALNQAGARGALRVVLQNCKMPLLHPSCLHHCQDTQLNASRSAIELCKKRGEEGFALSMHMLYAAGFQFVHEETTKTKPGCFLTALLWPHQDSVVLLNTEFGLQVQMNKSAKITLYWRNGIRFRKSLIAEVTAR